MKKVIEVSVRVIRSVQHFADSIIRRTYPFMHHDSAGRAVYLDQAYDVRRTLAGADIRRMPYSRRALPITLWKNFLELWLSVFFWMLASAVERLVGMPWGIILPILVVIYFLYQELYVDAELGRKNWVSVAVDSILWIIPSVWFIINLVL
jgi:hypothetical protein